MRIKPSTPRSWGWDRHPSPAQKLALHETGCLHSPRRLHSLQSRWEQNPVGIAIGIWPWPQDTGQLQRGRDDEQLPSLEATGHRPQGLWLLVQEQH